MTIKNFTSGSLYSARYLLDNKNGADGKYEMFNGYRREKWNAYTRQYCIQLSTPRSSDGLCVVSGSPTYHHSTPSGLMTNQLQSKLLQAVKHHDFNLGIALGEGVQTYRLITDTMKILGLTVRDIRLGHIDSAIRRLATKDLSTSELRLFVGRVKRLSTKDVASHWIELRYGWLPLLNDCYAAHSAYMAYYEPPRKTIVEVKMSSRDFYNSSQSPSNYSAIGPIVDRLKYNYEITEKLPTARQVGLYDPLSVAWELLPWSFVVDWFLPVSTWLENIAQIPMLTGRTCTTFSSNYVYSTSLKNKTNVYAGASSIGKSFYLTRTISSGLKTVSPSFKSLPKAMSPLHIANAIALMRQQFK